MTDNVNSPAHYCRFRVTFEPKDFTKWLPHPLASAMEYILRAPYKGNELEDLQKASFWLNELFITPGFWTYSAGHSDSLLILSCDDVGRNKAEYRAAAWAMAFRSPEVCLLLEETGSPLVITMHAVKVLAGSVCERVEKLKEEPGVCASN